MGATDVLAQGRAAYQRRDWDDAYDRLSAADGQTPLDTEDLERLAMAAYLTGREEDASEAWAHTYQALLHDGSVARAVRCAFWLGLTQMLRGNHARGGGWLARAQRTLEDASLDCVERGYVRLPLALHALGSGDSEGARATCVEIAEIADRYGDADLVALSRLGQGQALIAEGEAARGTALLDEAMVAVTSGEVSVITSGIVYCAVIIACRDIFDVHRADEWTSALSRWCASQPGLKPYRGQCLVHRSEIMQLRGEWSDALVEARQACAHLADPPGDPVMGMAQYQRADLLRLRGRFTEAEEAYRQASQWGHPAHPGLALLRLAQGRLDDAEAAIRRVATEAEDDRVRRCRVLAAYVEIVLATGDLEAARDAAWELEKAAADFDSPYLRAVAAVARGRVLLAEEEPDAACGVLRQAWVAWQEMEAPYEAARARLLLARAYERLGDRDTAEMELDVARLVFEQLGAAPDLAATVALSRRAAAPHAPGGLTRREVEVLRLVAGGATNREIADTLVISEKTVARHLSNMFAKLGISSRSAATAYAYEHDLV